MPDVIAEQGGDVARPFKDVGIPMELAGQTRQIIAARDYLALLEAAAEETGDPHLGLSLGSKFKIEDLGPFGRLVAGAPTLGEAIKTTNALIHAFSPTKRTGLEMSGGMALLWCSKEFGAADYAKGLRIDGELATWLYRTVIRLAAGADWQPGRVVLPPADPAYRRGFESRFGAPVRGEGNRYAVLLPPHLLDTPMTYAHRLDEPERRRLTAALASLVPDDSVTGLVRAFVRGRMSGGYPTMSDVARSMGLSDRTFQRQLANAGTTYSEIARSVRRDMAHDLLTDPRKSMLDVAMALGYSDQSNFTRAVKAWSGMTPSQYRLVAGDTGKRDDRGRN